MTTTLADQGERDRIRDDTAATLFVDAGAGSGKTSALVERVTTLVMRDGVALARIAAVTFTEMAGAELRDRLRACFETIWQARGVDAEIAQQALDDLDGAAIGTLHSFAQRILTEHPIKAGLPPSSTSSTRSAAPSRSTNAGPACRPNSSTTTPSRDRFCSRWRSGRP